MKLLIQQYWRIVLAHLPLPMLALAASYGVYTFNLLFVPTWVAITSAAAFELTYIGLAVTTLHASNTTRATMISASAVAVSIIYNSLAALFHRAPYLLELGLWVDIPLAILHGLPLALVAYFVADLLLHSKSSATPATKLPRAATKNSSDIPALQGYRLATASSDYTCPSCSSELANKQAYASAKRLGYCKQCKAS